MIGPLVDGEPNALAGAGGTTLSVAPPARTGHWPCRRSWST